MAADATAIAAALQQMLAGVNIQRTIKPIPKLRNQEEFSMWKSELIRALKREDLDKYITTNVPEPVVEEGTARR